MATGGGGWLVAVGGWLVAVGGWLVAVGGWRLAAEARTEGALRRGARWPPLPQKLCARQERSLTADILVIILVSNDARGEGKGTIAMPQLSLYLDDDTMDLLRQDAAREGVSLSKHASRVIRESSTSAWPKGFFDLYGALDDDTFVVPPELSWEDDCYSFDDFAFRN